MLKPKTFVFLWGFHVTYQHKNAQNYELKGKCFMEYKSERCGMHLYSVKLSLCPSLKSFAACNRFSPITISVSIYLPVIHIPIEEEHPNSMMLPPLCFSMGQGCLTSEVHCFLWHVGFIFLKVSFLSYLTRVAPLMGLQYHGSVTYMAGATTIHLSSIMIRF